MKKAMALMLVSVLLVACGGATPTRETTPTRKPPTPTRQLPVPTAHRCELRFGDLCLEELHYTTGEYQVEYAAGTVLNTGHRSYSYVQVEINLYDAQDNLVGSTFDNVNNLEPGARWKFKAIIFEKGVSWFRVMNITGF